MIDLFFSPEQNTKNYPNTNTSVHRSAPQPHTFLSKISLNLSSENVFT